MAIKQLMGKTKNSDPTFIVDIESREICDVNEEAIAGYNNRNPIGKKLCEIVYYDQNIGQAVSPVFFNDQWFLLNQETLLWEGSPHLQIRLERREAVPDINVLDSLKRMIGFLLHRIRSPLTGIQGYTEIMENASGETNKYIGKINKGLTRLFDILDELESLEEISLEPLELNNYSADPEEIIHNILADYDEEKQENITYSTPGETQKLHCNPGDLKRILSLLIDNAVEHAPIENYEISISHPAPNAVKISHNGTPIPESILKELYYPFVTTKARQMGIGLTMATLYAHRYKGAIFLTDNNPFREVSFTFCLPPSALTSNLNSYDIFS